MLDKREPEKGLTVVKAAGLLLAANGALALPRTIKENWQQYGSQIVAIGDQIAENVKKKGKSSDVPPPESAVLATNTNTSVSTTTTPPPWI